MNKKQIFKLLLIVSVLAYIPFLGLFDYNTKGEPRESIVSYSMLHDGNWILPRNNGGEMAYKPPFFHWSVAAASLVGGEVTEYTSRIPSAVAFIALIMFCFAFFSNNRYGKNSNAEDVVAISFVAALINLTCNELHRAGSNCRVDMLLTFFTVVAMFLLYRWWERGMKRVPVGAILLMSCGTLTKGPVGSIVPCLAVGVFLLLRGVNFWKALWKLVAIGAASLLIPAFWYYAAWQQGGQEFLDLMMEENIGRMTNTMAYDSCNEPWPYNFLTLIIGYLPYTIFLLMSLFAVVSVSRSRSREEIMEKRENRKLAYGSSCGVARLWEKIVRWVRSLNSMELFSLTSTVVIFIFYCIPQSKRSVYLMPIYPFISWFIARYLFLLANRKKRVIAHFNTLLAVLVLFVSAVFIAVKCGAVPDTVFSGKHAASNIATLHAIKAIGSGFTLRSVVEWLCVALSIIISANWFRFKVRRESEGNTDRDISYRGYIYYMMTIVVAAYFAVDAAYKPAALNAKSVKPLAAELRVLCPESEGKMYEYIELGETALGDPLHYFELNFYLGNIIENFKKSQPSNGFLLIGVKDAELRLPEFERNGYAFDLIYTSNRKVAGQIMNVYRISRTR